jgi:hypothetical protein
VRPGGDDAPFAPAPPAPACYRCGYDLTGLPEPRCPECGLDFDWADPRLRAPEPQIAFERTRGWRKIPAFFVTWLTLVLRPDLFARQAVVRISARHAAAFLVACFAFVLSFAAFPYFWPKELVIIWPATALAQIVAQTAVLYAFDWPHWRRPRESLRFWLLVGGYTSAIVATQAAYGPPVILAGELFSAAGRWLRGAPPSWLVISNLLEVDLPATFVFWVQMLIWMAALAACLAARLRRAGEPFGRALPAALLAVVAVFVLASLVTEWVGASLYAWLG